ncbi:MAG: ATP-binding cassette domain-containing protein [Eubacteriales bacterium]|nr:ATP-binding cassette domain-containing protein [Eubacteriales bacterium]
MLAVDIEKNLGDFRLQTAWTHPGGCLGILGRSGCGKSLTLQSIAGLIKPDRGRIESDQGLLFVREGKKAEIDLPPQQRKIGYLFQSYALFPQMTVAENVAVGLRYGAAASVDQAELAALLERLRISELAKRLPHQLSGGQQQRVALARLIAYRPEILLLDEPFAAMDGHLREVLRFELMTILREYGHDCVLVSHDRDDMYYMCEHCLLMDRGEVLEYGPTKELFRSIRYTESADLTGCKNVAACQRQDAVGHVFVPQWQRCLYVGRAISQRITDVGIRAHALQPMTEAQAEELRQRSGNLVSTEGATVTELPFGWQVVTKEGLWWKYERVGSEGFSLPPYLWLPPQEILLLEKKYEG